MVRKGFSELAVYFVDIYGQVTKSNTYPFSFKGSVSFKAGEAGNSWLFKSYAQENALKPV